MKKMMLLGALMMMCIAAVGHAQESRQDASISLFGVYAPPVYGLLIHPMTTTSTGGFLASYRYMLTPRSAVELNYTFAQDSLKYNPISEPNTRVHTRQQELSGAYVYMRTYKRYNPFVEGGIGAEIFTPILDNGTSQLSFKQSLQIGGLFGGGLAYEISPSFDIRAEYRGFMMKTPTLGDPGGLTQTNRFYILMTPSIGVAYHF
ncbi:MAG: outer membrane beta-barrel protein [Acidobacteriaceae bacterium]